MKLRVMNAERVLGIETKAKGAIGQLAKGEAGIGREKSGVV